MLNKQIYEHRRGYRCDTWLRTLLSFIAPEPSSLCGTHVYWIIFKCIRIPNTYIYILPIRYRTEDACMTLSLLPCLVNRPSIWWSPSRKRRYSSQPHQIINGNIVRTHTRETEPTLPPLQPYISGTTSRILAPAGGRSSASTGTLGALLQSCNKRVFLFRKLPSKWRASLVVMHWLKRARRRKWNNVHFMSWEFRTIMVTRRRWIWGW